MYSLFSLLSAFALVFANAFFVAAEFGMVKLRYTRVSSIKKMYGVRGKILATIHKHLDAYLSACQLGITLASLGLGWIGEPAFERLLEPIFHNLQITSPQLVKFMSFFVAFSFLSFLHIVVGELMPKSLAIRQPERVSLWTALPLYGFYWLMFPAIWLLNTCALFLLKVFGLSSVHVTDKFYSTDEIKLILSASHLHGELTKDEADILEHTLDFADLRVTEVMRPREEMISLSLSQSREEILKTILTHRFSRYPVYDSLQEIVGIVHIKDLFVLLHNKEKSTNLAEILRPVLKVNQRLAALNLLRQFREGKPHFALVYRAHELIGFVTLDNLLHVLIGRIKDEFHLTQEDWRLNADGSLTVSGACPIFALERVLNKRIDVSDEIETLSGLILHRVGYLPSAGERFKFKEFKIIIEKVRGHRLTRALIIPNKK